MKFSINDLVIFTEETLNGKSVLNGTAQKMKFSIKDFFSKCGFRKLRI